MQLILVRHGESEHSIRGVIADVSGCTGLTTHGRRQALALAARLARTDSLVGRGRCEVLLTSPVLRARQTAEILAPALGITECVEDADLCEVRPGEADGMSWDAYRERYGAFDLVAEPARPFSPGGESWAGFTTRVRATLDRLAERFGGRTVVAVSHAGFVVATVLVAFDIPRPGTRARFEPAHTSLTEWYVSGGIWRLERFNDTRHLATRRLPSDCPA